LLDNAAHVAGSEGNDVAGDETDIAMTDAENVPALLNPGPYHGSDGRVHAGGVTPTGQYGNTSHNLLRSYTVKNRVICINFLLGLAAKGRLFWSVHKIRYKATAAVPPEELIATERV
jgi:hypothetical protein